MTDRQIRDLWDSLQNKKPQMPHFLEKVAMTEIGTRRILDFQVEFKYPVSVLAGGNGSGKTTVLVIAQLAYEQPDTSKDALPHANEERSSSEFIPFPVFPDSKPKSGEWEDEKDGYTACFNHSTPDRKRCTRFRCPESYVDITQEHGVVLRHVAPEFPDGSPPERSVCFITPEHPINPSEIHSAPYMSNEGAEMQSAPLSSLQMELAQRLLPFRYMKVVEMDRSNFLSNNETNPLVVAQENGVIYADTHMAAGERTIFRLSQKMAQATGGLFLIDEVETSLHPSLQKSLMLELQQLALDNDLQIIVSTHSPVVLDSVPPIGRIFLERDKTGNILVGPAYTDLVYRALYGHHEKKFKLLCEDKVAKSILKGVFDVIIACDPPAEEESLNIQCTKDGASDFPRYARILKELNRDFVFILDGDQRCSKENIEEKIRSATEHSAQVMFLPGKGAPEEWVWERMRFHSTDLADMLDLDVNDLVQEMDKQDNFYISKVGSIAPKKIIKGKFRRFLKCAKCCKSEKIFEFCVLKICRMVSRLEAEREESDIQPLVEKLKYAFQTWREGAEDPGETEEAG